MHDQDDPADGQLQGRGHRGRRRRHQPQAGQRRQQHTGRPAQEQGGAKFSAIRSKGDVTEAEFQRAKEKILH